MTDLSMMQPSTETNLTGRRRELSEFIEGSRAVAVITVLIVINAIALGLETDAGIMASYGGWLQVLDRIILIVFTVELAIKFYACRWSFFRSGWNTFDFLIVAIAWVPASGPLVVLRALRVLRIMRLLSVVPQMRRVIGAIGHSIPGMLSVIGVLCLVFYVSAVLCTNLFGQHSDPRMQEWFGSVGASAYTLFQIMTLESWSMGIVRPTMVLFPYAWVFFVPFIIITSFAVLNLFIGIIVDAMQTAQEDPRDTDREDIKQFTHAEVEALHNRFDQLQQQLEKLNGTQSGVTTPSNSSSKS
ncbi:MAG: voltage-gated sodium channel [Alphaproteobacteria bacterium]|jgi:voltage-gated sodium channel